MNEMQIFNSAEFGTVRTLETTDGKVLLCGKDIAEALGYTNPQKAIRDHCKEDGVTICSVIDSMGRNQEAKFITEGNVYRLITHSKLPNAERFESWVFDEVLPTIRKNGGYGTINIEEVVVKAVTVAVTETVKAIMPLITPQSAMAEQPKRIRKKYIYTTPSKIATLSPELKEQVDEMIASGRYSCQQIANFIMNNSDVTISQMAVNRYRRMNFSEI